MFSFPVGRMFKNSHIPHAVRLRNSTGKSIQKRMVERERYVRIFMDHPAE